MNLFISYFKKSPAFFLTLLIVLVLEISLSLMPDLYYHDKGGAFLTTYKRKVAEDPQQKYDILMYGDSRSLSIIGNPRSQQQKYSLYNYSLPAAGVRYFKFYVKKYLKSHPTPKAIIWAADPEQFAHGRNKAFDTDPILWAKYKHRLLNLFSLTETWQQYEGKELFFITKEYIPDYLASIRYRNVLKTLITGFQAETVQQFFHPPQALPEDANPRQRDYLIGKIPNRVRNLRIQAILEKNYGQINLGDYFETGPALASILRKKQWQANIDKMQHKKYSLEYLEDFIRFCRAKKIPIILLNIPRARGYNDTPYFSSVVADLQKVADKYAQVEYLEFAQMDYPLELFGEGIHYTPEGSDRLNREFRQFIYPQIEKLIDRRQP